LTLTKTAACWVLKRDPTKTFILALCCLILGLVFLYILSDGLSALLLWGGVFAAALMSFFEWTTVVFDLENRRITWSRFFIWRASAGAVDFDSIKEVCHRRSGEASQILFRPRSGRPSPMLTLYYFYYRTDAGVVAQFNELKKILPRARFIEEFATRWKVLLRRTAAWTLAASSLVAPLYAASSGGEGFTQLQISPYARSAAMAEASTAYVADALSLYSNPAGLAHLQQSEVSFQYMSHFQDVATNALSYVRPSERGGWGVSVGLLSVDGIPKTTVDLSSVDRFVESGEVEAGSQLAAFSFARRQSRDLVWGATVKALQEKLAGENAMSLLADAGLIYRVDRFRRLAVVVQNAGSPGKFVSQSVPAPLRVRAGAYFAPRKWLQWEIDGLYRSAGPFEALVGTEMMWQDHAFLRFGYRRSFASSQLGFLAGASFGVGVKWNNFRMDYAFLPFDDLGSTHQLTVGWLMSRHK
jgi:hypothetical protein